MIFLKIRLKINSKEKININKIIVDPGIGFGKNLKHNLMLMNKISLFHSLGISYINRYF